MNDLTEQLTKQLASWSLPEYTEFYVRKKDGSTDTQTWINRRHSSPIEWWNIFNITEVLTPVPSYEEWKSKLEENTNLKELLKECRDEIDYLRKHYKGNIDHFKNNTRLDKEINQALGEDK